MSASFDLHGFVSIRLENARPADVAAVSRQLGPLRPSAAEADLVIRFVDRIDVRGPLRLLGLRDAAFSDDAFLVLRSKGKSAVRVRIPLEQVGTRCEILCEHGAPAVPLLVPIVNLTALGRGALPLHAAAFLWAGCGVLVTGWSKGGKTEALLAFAHQGASYVADEWCYVAPDGKQLLGLPEPLRLRRWQLRQLPDVRSRVRPLDRARLAALAAPAGLSARLPAPLARSRPGRALLRLAGFLDERASVLVPAERLFGSSASGAGASLTHLFWVVSAESPETRAIPIDPADVAARMVHSLAYERAPLLAYYRMFRFAFPQLSNPWLEKAEERERELCERAFAGRSAWRVEHPYPFELAALFECMEPLLRQ